MSQRREARAAMRAAVLEDVGMTDAVAPEHEILTEPAETQWPIAEV
jgi:hypothetical protein